MDETGEFDQLERQAGQLRRQMALDGDEMVRRVNPWRLVSTAVAAIRTDLGAIFVSMELSRRTWLITSLSPGSGEKMSKHSVPASDVAGLLHRFAELKRK